MKLFILFFGLCFFQIAYAVNPVMAPDSGSEQPPAKVPTEVVKTEQVPVAMESPDIVKMRIDNEFWYILLLSALSLASLIVVLSFIRLNNEAYTSRDIVNAAGLILIIFGTIILVLVVNTSEQLTAAIGILGAIAGYLFRSVQSEKTAGDSEPPAKQAPQ